MYTSNPKAERWFSAVDADGDGRITRQDMEVLADRISRSLGHHASSPQSRQIKRAYDKAWKVLARDLDVDRDDQISPEEFDAFVRERSDEFAAERLVRPIAEAEFTAADADGDGVITRDEYVRLLEAAGLPAAAAEQGAAAVDVDGSGRIDMEEYVRACRDFLAADGTDARAAQVFGQLA